MKLYRVLAHRDGKFALKPIGVVAEPDAAEFSAAASKFTSTSIPSNREQIKRETESDSKPFFPSRQHPRIFTRSLPKSKQKLDAKSGNLLKELGIKDEL